MTAKDRFHDLVKTALIQEGWTINDDPLHLRMSGVINMYIDLGAEKVIAAEKAGEKIAVEIKRFLGASTISEFHLAVGQFINYRYALEAEEPDRRLYLAVPLSVYEEFFKLTFIQKVVQRSQLNLLIYDVEAEDIVQWKP
ncbi:XisH family protein [Acaryochloris sp. IP29b_bin.137]|uniref:XisH family protein n=1 Tax=Acaryochloris sp. IP29b_bin.137 TaxID=2969217 RepID=UPI0026346829|nr:XisH family protein [Acaryochloris sp. IP29b_bin.137]